MVQFAWILNRVRKIQELKSNQANDTVNLIKCLTFSENRSRLGQSAANQLFGLIITPNRAFRTELNLCNENQTGALSNLVNDFFPN